MAGGIFSKLFGWLSGGKGASGDSDSETEAQEIARRAQERLSEATGTSQATAQAQNDNDQPAQSVVETMTSHASGNGAQEPQEAGQQSETSGADEKPVSTAATPVAPAQHQANESTHNIDSMEDFMSSVSMVVNGESVSGEVEDRTLLVSFLRDQLRLTGTHVGCDTSQCGSCVVHVDGKAVKSCTMLAVQADGSTVTTIEGLANGGDLHPVQTAFKEHHGLQCGFCTPGMIMCAVDMIERYKSAGKTLDEATIRAELEGNICRCTGYHNIVKAISAAAEASA